MNSLYDLYDEDEYFYNPFDDGEIIETFEEDLESDADMLPNPYEGLLGDDIGSTIFAIQTNLLQATSLRYKGHDLTVSSGFP